MTCRDIWTQTQKLFWSKFTRSFLQTRPCCFSCTLKRSSLQKKSEWLNYKSLNVCRLQESPSEHHGFCTVVS